METEHDNQPEAPPINPFYSTDIGAWGDRPKRAMHDIDQKGCFIWNGCYNSRGYPCRGRWLVHRLAWTAFFGAIPADYQVHHECGDRRCINYRHLRCLSVREHRLLGNSPLKLDADMVREILRLVVEGVPRRDIAARFDIARHYVNDIKNGKTWKCVVQEFWSAQTEVRIGVEMRRAA